MPTLLMPNVVLLAARWLQASDAVAALVDNRISYRLGATYPQIRLSQVGVNTGMPEEGYYVVGVECWASDHDTADLIARTVVAAVPDARGDYADVGSCRGSAVESGPYQAPDANAERWRYQVDIGLWIYPLK